MDRDPATKANTFVIRDDHLFDYTRDIMQLN